MAAEVASRRRTPRTRARLSKAHLGRLGAIADAQHAELTRSPDDGGNLSDWADRRVAVVLAQGAALHYLYPDGQPAPIVGRGGVKDLDVWTFYAAIPDRPLRTGRYEVCRDFGPSALGRNLYLDSSSGASIKWNQFSGRRVDLLARDLHVELESSSDEVIAALRHWLSAGASKPCVHKKPNGKSPSPHWLAHKAMVWIGTPDTRRRAGRKVWDVHVDAPQLLGNGSARGE
jgi:hypothetical protein